MASLIKDYEDQKPEGVSAPEHERKWEHAAALRIALVREKLIVYADVLAEASAVSKLH